MPFSAKRSKSGLQGVVLKERTNGTRYFSARFWNNKTKRTEIIGHYTSPQEASHAYTIYLKSKEKIPSTVIVKAGRPSFKIKKPAYAKRPYTKRKPEDIRKQKERDSVIGFYMRKEGISVRNTSRTLPTHVIECCTVIHDALYNTKKSISTRLQALDALPHFLYNDT